MLIDKTIPVPESGCMLWEGFWHPRSGYGRAYNRGNSPTYAQAHRAVWEEINGPIPEGMKLLHRCDTPPCCNPQHLFLGTQTDNMRDMAAKKRGNMQKKTHCPQGHAYEGENLRIDHKGARVCRICGRAATRASYYKRSA